MWLVDKHPFIRIGIWNITFFISHMITWPRQLRITWICFGWPFVLIHQSTKSGGKTFSGSKYRIEVGGKVGRYIDKIILWQSMANRFCRGFLGMFHITQCNRLLLQSATRLLSQVCQLLQRVTVITKWQGKKFCFKF